VFGGLPEHTVRLDQRWSAKMSKPAAMSTREPAARPYALGYTEREFRRLTLQGEFFRDLTADVLERAGIAPGMHVLDVGCGIGDVSLLAAELVGLSGSVVGVDRSAEATRLAAWRAAEAGFEHARFAVSEIDAFSAAQRFDAVVGRLMLLYLPDPAATLRRLAGLLRPGGIVAFHEMAMTPACSVPDGPLWRRTMNWVTDTFTRAGFEVDVGHRLYATFLAAGLPAPEMISTGRVEGGEQSPAYEVLAATVRSLLPIAERLGVATAAEVDVDSLAERLRREAVEHNACLMPR
jgi:ubiquinone/menaquinone biosynthesis C-methylase UbiE